MYSDAQKTSPVFFVILFVSAFSISADEFTVPHDIRIPSPEEMGPDVYLMDPDVPLSPPDSVEVGDSWIWWLWTWQPMPPHFEQHSCTIRGMSDRGYVAVKDDEWLVTIDQNDVDSILEHWDNSSIGPYPDQGIYEIDSLSFGDPPDELDDDPRIYLMWYNFHISADGFFFYFDQYPEGTYPGYHSNECEVLYLNTTSPGGPSGDYMHAVIAHEFQHLIHWKYDEDETSWVNEGMSELAMWFYGNPDNISSFNTNPDNNLTIWDGNWADYIQTYLWSLYFFERYGGHPAVYALVHEADNSMTGFDDVLDNLGYSENTEDIFIDWSVANFLDDTTIEDGRYGYLGDDLPPFAVSGTYSTYPVSEDKTVNSWATDYYRFQSIPFDSLTISFDGSDSNRFGARALVLHNSSPTEVLSVNLDVPTQSGTVEIGIEPLDQVILVVASTSSSGGPDYAFTAGDAEGITHDPSLTAISTAIETYPNPFNSSVNITFSWSGAVYGDSPTIDIFDINGRLVSRLDTHALSDCRVNAFWNGELPDGNRANAGIYYARAGIGSIYCVRKLLLLP